MSTETKIQVPYSLIEKSLALAQVCLMNGIGEGAAVEELEGELIAAINGDRPEETQAGDICPDCELIGVPGALCPKHAATGDLLAACEFAITAIEEAARGGFTRQAAFSGRMRRCWKQSKRPSKRPTRRWMILVLSIYRGRKVYMTLPDGREMSVMVLDDKTNQVRLGFDAPEDVSIQREEVRERIREREQAVSDPLDSGWFGEGLQEETSMIAEATKTARELWLESRRTGIGGSDATAACGMSKWKTKLELYLDKRGALETEENEPMRWGTRLEPVVRQEYCDQTGRTIVVPEGIVRHPTTPFAILTADGIADSDRLYEGKTARTSEGWGDPGTDEIPTQYLFQVQHGMYVLNLPVADVAVLIGGSDFRIYTIEADPEFQALMIAQEAEFWRCVQEGTPPAPTNAADMKRRWRVSSGRTIQASDEMLSLVGQLAEAKRFIKSKEEQVEDLETKIKQYMEDAAEMTHCGKAIVTWKNVNASRKFDMERFKDEFPNFHQEFLIDAKPRRLFHLKKQGD